MPDLLLSSHGLGLSRSARATGSSQWGQRPPGPIRRQNCWHSGQRCSPKYRVPQAGHSYTVAGRGVWVGRGGRGAAWPRRQAAWRQAAEQKRCRPTGTNARPQRGQLIVTLSLRYGLSTIPGLRSSGLGPPAAQLVRDGPLAQVAEPFALGAVRPHDPAAQARGFLPGLGPAAADPVLQGALREPEDLAQLGAPPFVRAQLGARAGPGPRPRELQPPAQVTDRLHPEGAAPGGPVPGRVQALGDARGRQALLGPGPHPLTDRRVRTQVAGVPNRPNDGP